jgi:threonine synthase
MAAVRETDGAYIQVSDQKILAAIPALARGCGVFAEPAGAAAYAGLLKALDEELVRPDERIVVLVTGNGLKDVASAMKSVEQVGTQPYHVSPDLEDLKRVMDRVGRVEPTNRR